MIVGDMIFSVFPHCRWTVPRALSWLETSQLTPKLYELEKIVISEFWLFDCYMNEKSNLFAKLVGGKSDRELKQSL